MRRPPLPCILAASLLAAAPAAAQPVSLDSLRRASERAHSDAVLVLRDGKEVAAWPSEADTAPIELMSATKSIVGLAVGRLLLLGHLDSLGVPVAHFYPEWRQGQKRHVTVRHLLAHTSGLQNVPDASTEIYRAPDIVQLALAAELDAAPGTVYHYNNKAVNLLAGIVERASGLPLDTFVAEGFFRPMGIASFAWMRDPAGTPFAMAGLALRAADLAKFGTLVLDEGRWNGVPLVDAEFVRDMLAPGHPSMPRMGLLWGRMPSAVRYTLDVAKIDALDPAQVAASDLAALRSLGGRTFANRAALTSALEVTFGSAWRSSLTQRLHGQPVGTFFRQDLGPIAGYYAEGYRGQVLLVVPATRTVAVRQVRSTAAFRDSTDGFDAFKELVLNLAGPPEQ